jgi:Lon protease-like protein
MAKKATGRMNWFDEHTQEPLIEQYARQLDSFIQTMADGRVDASEVKAQEVRLMKLMKEIEPELNDALHAKITQLLCELTAYDLMQMLHAMQGARAKTVLRL